jgi:micrococcal nuclease
VNAELLRRGYAQLMTVPPNVRFVEFFIRLQQQAREEGRGLWGEPPPADRGRRRP